MDKIDSSSKKDEKKDKAADKEEEKKAEEPNDKFFGKLIPTFWDLHFLI